MLIIFGLIFIICALFIMAEELRLIDNSTYLTRLGLFISTLALIIITIVFVPCLTSHITIKNINADIFVLNDTLRQQTSLVEGELSRRYPEIESSILSNVNPAIIMAYPQLRSSETITKAVEIILGIENEIKENRLKINRVKADYAAVWTIMIFWERDYDKVYGEAK